VNASKLSLTKKSSLIESRRWRTVQLVVITVLPHQRNFRSKFSCGGAIAQAVSPLGGNWHAERLIFAIRHCTCGIGRPMTMTAPQRAIGEFHFAYESPFLPKRLVPSSLPQGRLG
jgi:hypothetical protein